MLCEALLIESHAVPISKEFEHSVELKLWVSVLQNWVVYNFHMLLCTY